MLILATALVGLGIAGSGWIVGSIVAATLSAGGDIRPLRALTLGTMSGPAPDATETIATVEGERLQAAIYLPGGLGPAPVAVYVHGGGFIGGTRTETASDLRWFADRGWLVLSIDYRLFRAGHPTWDKAAPDAACGLVWARENASRLGGDPARIVLMGDSAGGNLAINVAYAAAQGRAVSSCGGRVTAPLAVAVQYPAVDPIAIYERGFPIPGFEPAMLMQGFIGGTPEQYPDRVASVSSATWLTPEAPPTLVVSPDRDSLVVSDSVRAFAARAASAGVSIELVRIPFANHIFNQIAAGSLGNQAGLTIRQRFLTAAIAR